MPPYGCLLDQQMPPIATLLMQHSTGLARFLLAANMAPGIMQPHSCSLRLLSNLLMCPSLHPLDA